jgi:NAD(P)-dependent dehydrogenase (short-subunit alcohol dehydrogenase family)
MKSVVITGASTGIGYELSKVFVNNDYTVFGSVRKKEDADKILAELGDKFIPLLFDVTDQEGIDAAVETVRGKIGDSGLTGLINNAGVAIGGPIQYLNMEKFRYQFDVNFFGLIAVTKAFLPLLGAVKGYPFPPGRIMNMSSVSGKIPFPLLSPYCSSKFALEAFSHALRSEMIPYGIKVIIMGPGSIKTPIWGKAPEPSEKILQTVYGKALSKFYKRTQETGENGLEADVFAERTFRIFEAKNPKYRYSILKNKFKLYTLPRLLINTKLMKGFFEKMFEQ